MSRFSFTSLYKAKDTEYQRESRGISLLRAENISKAFTGRLRRSTLVTLRWIAILGQSLTLAFVYLGLGYDFPVIPAASVICLSIIVNVWISQMLPLDRRVDDSEAMAQLGFDIMHLAGLLWLTGGMTNPFALLFIAPVVTSATTLSRSVLASLGCLSATMSFALLYVGLPLPWSEPGGFDLPFVYQLGMWLALMTGMIFTSTYAWRSAKESRRMSEALAATEAVLAQEQKLAALGGMAAAAAHELGTPLATIQLTAKELVREFGRNTPHEEDLKLLISQSQRCRDILQQLAYRGDEGDLIHDSLSLEALLDEAVEPYRGLGTEINLRVEGMPPMPQLGRESEIIYGLKNFVENAVGFADTTVVIRGVCTPTVIEVTISDDGPGFDPAIMSKLGEPYVSSREEKALLGRDNAGGLGLGFFIAKTLIERTGGKVRFGNNAKRGAWVKLLWPRHVIDIQTKTPSMPYLKQ